MATVLDRKAQDGGRFTGKTRNRWTVRYYQDGRQREKSFATRAQAEKFAAAPSGAPASSMTLDAWFPVWLERRHLAPSTERAYEIAYRLHISPVLGRARLGRLDRNSLRRVSQEHKVRAVLSGMLKDAALEGLMPALEMPARPRTAVTRAEFHDVPKADLERLVSQLADFGDAVWLMRYAGLRVAEALGVLPDDLDAGILRVTRQRLRDGRTGPLKGRRPGEYRDVPVPSWLTVPAFPELRPDAFRARWRTACRLTKMPAGFHPHELRHAYVSDLLTRGIPVATVAHVIGHRDIRVTFSTYGHLLRSADDGLRAVLEGLA